MSAAASLYFSASFPTLLYHSLPFHPHPLPALFVSIHSRQSINVATQVHFRDLKIQECVTSMFDLIEH